MAERREEAERREADPEADEEQTDSSENAADLSPVQLALQSCTFASFQLKRAMYFNTVEDASVFRPVRQSSTSSSTHHKPAALPLRMQHGISIQTCPKQPEEEPREPRFPSTAPLEQSEHEWLVRCASGHWSQAYGLLLRDNQLAEKRDFISGFTALHWAAKSGNSDMLAKIIAMSKQGGADVDVNTKTHGGYTPLHIAALHHQEFILAMLVEEFGADANIRDNCGKRAYHYLHKGISERLRELLGEPRRAARETTKEELDLS